MRYVSALFCLILALSNASTAMALDAAAHAVCVDDAHVVSVSGSYREEAYGEIYDGEISGLVFKCEAIGVCEPSFFYPDTPLAFDPQPGAGGWSYYAAEFSISPPLPGVAYRYTPFGVRPDGTLVPTEHHCDNDSRSYALIGCEGVPVARGVLEINSTYGDEVYFQIDNCAANCWTENIWSLLDIQDVEDLSGQPWGNLVGQVVDVSAARTYCTMPPGSSHVFTGIALGPNGDCGPVPVESESWGSLKGMYR